MAKKRAPRLLMESDITDMQIPGERLRALREDDRFIVSYPRSGNRWLRMMLRDVIVAGGPDIPAPSGLSAFIPDLHQCDPGGPVLEQFGVKARILKSHNLRVIEGRPMIYLFRRAADALISLYYFRLKHQPARSGESTPSAEEFCRRATPGWIEHLTLALRARDGCPTRTCFIAYEALHAAPVAALCRAVNFLGIDAGEDVVRTVIERNTFERSRADVGNGAGPGTGPILRKGRVGSASEDLRAESVQEIERNTAALYEAALVAASA